MQNCTIWINVTLLRKQFHKNKYILYKKKGLLKWKMSYKMDVALIVKTNNPKMAFSTKQIKNWVH